MDVDFYFGPGSRYSYLAATQLPRLAAETGAVFRWRCAISADLVAPGEADPFADANRRGQYASDYRLRDVERWARHYRVPFFDVGDSLDAWRRRALACVAAERLNRGAEMGAAMLIACHGQGEPPRTDADYARLANVAGLNPDLLLSALAAPDTSAAYTANVARARAAGAFGVPTFVTADGALFFGQDRLPLLRDHLAASRA